jgi:hypothetical protein
MLFGHNTNITIADSVYHVQTEDRGTQNALIDTTVYCRGRVIHRRTNNYFDLLPLTAETQAALKSRLDAQHDAVLQEMRAGTLSLTPPPTPAPEAAPPKAAGKSLIVVLANPKEWLTGKRASLRLLVSNSEGISSAGTKIILRVEGAAVPFERSVTAGADGFAQFDFDMPKLSGGDPAIAIEAAKGDSRGSLRFQLRAKPRVPTS